MGPTRSEIMNKKPDLQISQFSSPNLGVAEHQDGFLYKGRQAGRQASK